MKIFSMRETTLFKVAIIALLGIALHGCKKPSNGIDNNEVVTKPYSLFIGDSSGAIYNTSDGANFKHLDFGFDGTPCRAISTSGNNLLMIKVNAFVRVGNDKNFNPLWSENKVDPTRYYQPQIFDVPSFKRIYFAANSGNGVWYSDTSGAQTTWVNDNDINLPGPGGPPITSYTQLEDGTLIGFSDADRSSVYNKSSTMTPWVRVSSSGLPGGGQFYVTHLKNMIIAGDYTGTNGVWYSSNKGATWQQFNGLPAGAQVLSMNPAFEQALLVGTGSGIYRLTINTATFLSSNVGIGSNAIVRGLVQKYDQYKNGQIKQYVYAATSVGLYRSEDLGLNWVQIVSTTLPATNFTAIY